MAALKDILQKVGTGTAASAFESQRLDFKRSAPNLRQTLELLADAAVCFANATGGTIVLGVDDKGTTREDALVGVEPSLSVDAIRKGIFDRTRPSLTVSARDHHEDGRRLVIIDVIEGIELYANTKGLATRRLGKECLPFPPEQQIEVRRARGQIDWSAEDADATIGELSQGEFERIRRLLGRAGREELAALRDQALLEAMRLLTPSGRLTNAAVLLFGGDDLLRRAIPAHGYSYQYRPSPGSEATFVSRGNRAIPIAVETLLEL